ncbi:MAG: response regulator [bacterium]|nr:response regulator [bacterium]
MKRTMSTTQVAELLGVSAQTIANWIDNGQLPAGRTPGGHRRVSAQDLLAFLETRGLPVPAELVDRRHTVLVVEDDPQVGPWLVLRLSTVRPDLRVLLAKDGFGAGEMVATERPDTMLLDIYLPGLDGFEVCRRVKERQETRGTDVIAMSAHDTREVRDAILAAGATCFLPKPIDFAKLLAVLAQKAPAAVENT